MNATAIILLIGVCSFWALFGVFVMILKRARKTLETLENTLQGIDGELRTLSPTLAGTMRQLEQTGQNIGKTAGEVETLVHGVNSRGVSPTAAGIINYLPLALTAFRLIKPVFQDRKNRE